MIGASSCSLPSLRLRLAVGGFDLPLGANTVSYCGAVECTTASGAASPATASLDGCRFQIRRINVWPQIVSGNASTLLDRQNIFRRADSPPLNRLARDAGMPSNGALATSYLARLCKSLRHSAFIGLCHCDPLDMAGVTVIAPTARYCQPELHRNGFLQNPLATRLLFLYVLFCSAHYRTACYRGGCGLPLTFSNPPRPCTQNQREKGTSHETPF